MAMVIIVIIRIIHHSQDNEVLSSPEPVRLREAESLRQVYLLSGPAIFPCSCRRKCNFRSWASPTLVLQGGTRGLRGPSDASNNPPSCITDIDEGGTYGADALVGLQPQCS